MDSQPGQRKRESRLARLRGESPGLTSLGKTLRKNPTETESLLWGHLRNRQLGGHKFRRQVHLGQYVVDFLCWERRLVVEVDGSQHGESSASDHDRARTAWLEAEGFSVLRFWNNEVKENVEGVAQVILAALEGRVRP